MLPDTLVTLICTLVKSWSWAAAKTAVPSRKSNKSLRMEISPEVPDYSSAAGLASVVLRNGQRLVVRAAHPQLASDTFAARRRNPERGGLAAGEVPDHGVRGLLAGVVEIHGGGAALVAHHGDSDNVGPTVGWKLFHLLRGGSIEHGDARIGAAH